MSTEQQDLILDTFPLHGMRLIEASAGTGKTYSIAALYVRLVLGHGREVGGLMPPEILVLTFTVAATQELRDRIRKRLTEAARAFRTGDAGKDDFLNQLLNTYSVDADRERCAHRLQVAAEWMDEAAIHTIHAWCQTMLRQHAFDSCSLFEQEVGGTDAELWQRAVNDYWRRHMYLEHSFSDRLEDIADTPDELARKLRDIRKPSISIRANGKEVAGLSPNAALESLTSWKKECERLIDTLKPGWKESSEEVIERFNEAVKAGYLLKPYKDWQNCERWFGQLDDWLKGQPFPGPEVADQLRPDKVQSKVTKAKAKPNAKAPEHPWLNRLAEVLDSLPPEPRLQTMIWPHVIDWVRDRYRQYKRQRNLLDFDDLLIHLDQALVSDNGERLRQTILGSYPVAMIDEFQDTDPVQYRIFERVYLPERKKPEHGLFMIGDPKQAIYAFRGADIHTYLKARERTGSDDRYTLPRNHRSSHVMVDAVNCLFSAGNGNPVGAFGFRAGDENPAPFREVRSAGCKTMFLVEEESLPESTNVYDGQESARPAPLTFWYQEPGEGLAAIGMGEYREHMAVRAAAEMSRLLNLGLENPPRAGFRANGKGLVGVRPSDMAVLVANRREADAIQQQMRLRGIDSVYLSERNSIFDQPEAVDLLSVLEAAASPRNDYLVRNALGAASLCTSLEELDRINVDEVRLEAEIERFECLGRVWQGQGVLAMIRRLLTDREIPARLVGRGAAGERTLTNLLHLAELLQAENERHEGAQGLINWLMSEIDRADRSENDQHTLRLESDADLVKVVTIFKAKGLEYPLVFVPFPCCYRMPDENTEFLEFHDRQGNRVVEVDGDEQALAMAKREKLQEHLRLFYVALTRSVHACWVGVAPTLYKKGALGKNDRPELHATAPGHLLLGMMTEHERGLSEKGAPPDCLTLLRRLVEKSDGKMCLESEREEIEVVPVSAGHDDEALGPAREYSRKGHENWWIASYSALRHGSDEITALDEAGSAVAANLEEMARDEEADGERSADPRGLEPEPESIHAFPRGASPGNFLHLLLEWAGQSGLARLQADRAMLEEEIQRRVHRRGWSRWQPVLTDWFQAQLAAPIDLGDSSPCLADLKSYRTELEFWLQASHVQATEIDALVTKHTLGGQSRAAFEPSELNGMLHGFIDLVFEWQGRWYVADYKSNWLGPDHGWYTAERMTETVRSRRYDMQYVLYTLALHRLLKGRLGPSYKPAEHLGGAVYLFLRGCTNADTAGVFFEKPDLAMIDQLDAMFRSGEVDHAA